MQNFKVCELNQNQEYFDIMEEVKFVSATNSEKLTAVCCYIYIGFYFDKEIV
jgi:hypothetical protein